MKVSCGACQRRYLSQAAYDDHLESTSHKANESKMEVVATQRREASKKRGEEHRQIKTATGT